LLPEFKRFLRPLRETELRSAAQYGPIAIINVSDLRCDTLLIEYHQVQALALPSLSKEEVEAKATKGSLGSSRVLEWLWNTIAGPVLNALGFTQPPGDSWPHVWWIPTRP